VLLQVGCDESHQLWEGKTRRGKWVRSIFLQNPNVLPGGRLTVKTGGPSASVCCLLSFEVWIFLDLRIYCLSSIRPPSSVFRPLSSVVSHPASSFVAWEREKARSHLTMVRFPSFHRPEHEKAHSHLTMIRFLTFHRLEREKARSHLTMVRFPSFHRPEREKARSHLTMVRFPSFHRPEHPVSSIENPVSSAESRRFFSNLLEIKLEIWYNASNYGWFIVRCS